MDHLTEEWHCIFPVLDKPLQCWGFETIPVELCITSSIPWRCGLMVVYKSHSGLFDVFLHNIYIIFFTRYEAIVQTSPALACQDSVTLDRRRLWQGKGLLEKSCVCKYPTFIFLSLCPNSVSLLFCYFPPALYPLSSLLMVSLKEVRGEGSTFNPGVCVCV